MVCMCVCVKIMMTFSSRCCTQATVHMDNMGGCKNMALKIHNDDCEASSPREVMKQQQRAQGLGRVSAPSRAEIMPDQCRCASCSEESKAGCKKIHFMETDKCFALSITIVKLSKLVRIYILKITVPKQVIWNDAIHRQSLVP